jgi:hypothetical protein
VINQPNIKYIKCLTLASIADPVTFPKTQLPFESQNMMVVPLGKALGIMKVGKEWFPTARVSGPSLNSRVISIKVTSGLCELSINHDYA